MANAITETPVSTEITTWKVDPSHTTVEFVAKHMMISKVRGRFPDVEGIIQLDEKNFVNSSVEATIQVATINSGSEQRDNHLRTSDFFLADEHPVITFRSKRIVHKGGNEYDVIGDLTIRGKTQEVTLDTVFEGRNISPWGTEAVGFTAETTINRRDFDLNWNVALETGGVLVSDKIKIELSIEATKNQEQAEIEAQAEVSL